MGGYALAHNFALGGYSTALQANTAAATAFAEQSPWLRFTAEPWVPFLVPVCVFAMIAGMAFCAAKLRRG